MTKVKFSSKQTDIGTLYLNQYLTNPEIRELLKTEKFLASLSVHTQDLILTSPKCPKAAVHWFLGKALTPGSTPIEALRQEGLLALILSNYPGEWNLFWQANWHKNRRELDNKQKQRIIDSFANKRAKPGKYRCKELDLSGIDLDKEIRVHCRDLSYINFNHADFDYTSFISCNLSHCKLEKVAMFQATLDDSNLQYSNLKEADLREATLKCADFSNSTLEAAILEETDLSWATMNCCNLEYSMLKKAKLIGAKLMTVNLKRANLKDANLENANLKGANLEGANLKGANLKGADFTNANLRSANLEGADTKGAIFKNVTY
jgi:uncharacterized protein YjbI with pentapeptide repeats